MSIQRKRLVVSLFLLTVLTGVFCVVKFLLPNVKQGSKSFNVELANCESIPRLIDVEEGKIKSITVKNETGQYTIRISKNENGESVFSLQKSDRQEINQDLVEQSIIKNFLAELLAILPVKIVEEDSNNLEKYGLDKEKATITLVFDENKEQTLSIGDEAPLEIGYYLKDNTKQSNVYLITQSASEVFFFPMESFLVNAKKA